MSGFIFEIQNLRTRINIRQSFKFQSQKLKRKTEMAPLKIN